MSHDQSTVKSTSVMHFEGPIASVDNQGTQTNVAAVVEGDQVGVFATGDLDCSPVEEDEAILQARKELRELVYSIEAIDLKSERTLEPDRELLQGFSDEIRIPSVGGTIAEWANFKRRVFSLICDAATSMGLVSSIDVRPDDGFRTSVSLISEGEGKAFCYGCTSLMNPAVAVGYAYLKALRYRQRTKEEQ